MNESLIYPAREIGEFCPSIYSNKPVMHAYELPDAVSLNVNDLFPNIPKPIYAQTGDDVTATIEATRKSLEKVDMSKIKPGDSVNILTCEHGFLMMGGVPYIEMIKEIKRVVEERTGAFDIRVKLVMYRTPREGSEVIDFYKLNEEIGNVEGVTSYEKGVAIKTRIGTVYGLDKAFDADKIIFAYYDDPREVYCSRYVRKSFKAFTMDLMRLETRAMYHFGFGDFVGSENVGRIVPLSVYDSDFIQDKWVFATMMCTTPNGLTGIDADNSLYTLDDRVSEAVLKYYPYLTELLRNGEDYFIILDGERWPYYTHCAGIINGVCMAAFDPYDTSIVHNSDYYYQPDAVFKPNGYKGAILNQAWYGCTFWGSAANAPCILVGDELEYNFTHDSQNMPMMGLPTVEKVSSLTEAIEHLKEKTGTDRYLIFDGSYGYINCSRSAAEDIIERAPKVKALIDNELYPMYMEQRNLAIPDYMK